MEVKEWSYKEYHSFDKPVDGVTRMKMYVWLFSINMMDLAGLRAYRLWEKPN